MEPRMLTGMPDALKGTCPAWEGLRENRPQGTTSSFYSIQVNPFLDDHETLEQFGIYIEDHDRLPVGFS